MPCIPTFKRVLNVFVLNQFGEKLDRTRRNTSASTSSFQDDLRGWVLFLLACRAEIDSVAPIYRVTAPNVQIISTATAGEEHYSYFKSHVSPCPSIPKFWLFADMHCQDMESRLSILGHSNHFYLPVYINKISSNLQMTTARRTPSHFQLRIQLYSQKIQSLVPTRC